MANEERLEAGRSRDHIGPPTLAQLLQQLSEMYRVRDGLAPQVALAAALEELRLTRRGYFKIGRIVAQTRTTIAFHIIGDGIDRPVWINTTRRKLNV